MRRQWWLLVVAIVVVALGLSWWRGRRAATPAITEQAAMGEGEPTEDRVNQFLQKRGYALPDNVKRVDLADVTGGAAVGVGTVEQQGNGNLYTIVADLPEPSVGWYVGWLLAADGRAVSLGNLRVAKGGYLVEQQLSGTYTQMVVSRETKASEQPTTIVLRGMIGE